jgi:hypothetical protein
VGSHERELRATQYGVGLEACALEQVVCVEIAHCVVAVEIDREKANSLERFTSGTLRTQRGKSRAGSPSGCTESTECRDRILLD